MTYELRDCVLRTIEPDSGPWDDGKERDDWAAGLHQEARVPDTASLTAGFDRVGAINDRDLALRQVREAIAPACPKGFVCAADLDAPATVGTYEVPVDLNASDVGGSTGTYVRIYGTIRVRLTEQPGKCWRNFAHRSALTIAAVRARR